MHLLTSKYCSVEASFKPAKYSLLYVGLLRAYPIITPILGALPNRQNDRLRLFFDASLNVLRRIMAERESNMTVADDSDRDVLSVLSELYTFLFKHGIGLNDDIVRANRAENPGKRLSDEELISQVWSVLSISDSRLYRYSLMSAEVL